MRILVAHDGSEQADKALNRAVDLALLSKGSLFIISVVPDLCIMEMSDDECKKMYTIMTDESEKRLDKLKQNMSEKGLEIVTKVQFGSPVESILNMANETKADMIVIGSHGRHGAKKFLMGSVSSKVADHAACEVLVVK